MLSPRITASLTYWSGRTPDAIAIECDGVRLTWRELGDSVEALAESFVEDGLTAGERIGYLCENGVGIIQTILAAVMLDAVVVPLNTRLTAQELEYIVDDSGITRVLTDARYAHLVEALRVTRDIRTYWQGPDCPPWAEPLATARLTDSPARLRVVVGDGDTPAFISYTSGTTGRPKGAVISHANFAAAALSFSMTEALTRHDSSLLVLPLAFTGSLIATWSPAYHSGARFVMHPRFDAAKTLAELETGDITVFYAVPVVFQQMAQLQHFGTADLSRVRVAKAGGAPPPAQILDTYLKRGIPIGQGYGMTESAGVGTSLDQEDFTRKAGSAGRTNYGVELSIRDVAHQPAPVGDVGEIWLRGAAVILGYWRDPAATAEAIVDGWLRTGDLGSLDEDGYLTIVGREKDMVLSGGLNVYPSEVERVILLDARITEAAVIAVPDERWGEVPAALIVSDCAELTADGIKAAIKAELADYKIPKYYRIRQEPLPRTMSGKIAKAQLRSELLESLAGELAVRA